jgi:hypothetical protein
MKKLLFTAVFLLALTLCACNNETPAETGETNQSETEKTEFTAEELFGTDFTKTENAKMTMNYNDVTDEADIKKAMELIGGLKLKKVEMLPLEGGIPVSVTVGDKTIDLTLSQEVIGFGGNWYEISEEILDGIVEIRDKYWQ